MSAQSRPLIFVLPTFDGGGAERITMRVATALHRHGHPVLVAALLEGPETSNRREIPCVGLDARRVSESFLALRKLFSAKRPAAVLSTLKHVSIVVAAARALGSQHFRHVIRVANTYSRELAPMRRPARILWRGALRWSHRTAERSVCVSSGVVTDLTNHYGVPLERCIRISNPVDIAQLTLQAKQSSSLVERLPKRGPLFLAVGRLTPQKDFANLIRGFSLVRQQGGDCSLLILGEGPERQRLQELINELGLGQHVHMPGWVDNPYPAYDAADVFVLSSRFEGLPNVVLEALSFGLPVVSTDCESGPREILTSQDLGELVPVGDSAALAAAMQRAMRMRKESGRVAYVAANYDLPAIVRKYEAALLDD